MKIFNFFCIFGINFIGLFDDILHVLIFLLVVHKQRDFDWGWILICYRLYVHKIMFSKSISEHEWLAWHLVDCPHRCWNFFFQGGGKSTAEYGWKFFSRISDVFRRSFIVLFWKKLPKIPAVFFRRTQPYFKFRGGD